MPHFHIAFKLFELLIQYHWLEHWSFRADNRSVLDWTNLVWDISVSKQAGAHSTNLESVKLNVHSKCWENCFLLSPQGCPKNKEELRYNLTVSFSPITKIPFLGLNSAEVLMNPQHQKLILSNCLLMGSFWFWWESTKNLAVTAQY